jgi:tRNA-dihydrouridine synthase A
VPPLRYDVVDALKRDFPSLTVVLNGGVTDWPAIDRALERVDGVMLGRVAYHDPWMLAQADTRVFGEASVPRSRAEIVHALVPYVEAQMRRGVPLRAISRHILGLYQGVRGARAWRRILSDAARLNTGGPRLLLEALAVVEGEAVAA